MVDTEIHERIIEDSKNAKRGLSMYYAVIIGYTCFISGFRIYSHWYKIYNIFSISICIVIFKGSPLQFTTIQFSTLRGLFSLDRIDIILHKHDHNMSIPLSTYLSFQISKRRDLIKTLNIGVFTEGPLIKISQNWSIRCLFFIERICLNMIKSLYLHY